MSPPRFVYLAGTEGTMLSDQLDGSFQHLLPLELLPTVKINMLAVVIFCINWVVTLGWATSEKSNILNLQSRFSRGWMSFLSNNQSTHAVNITEHTATVTVVTACIAAEHGSFNHIHQVSPVCTLISNMWFLVWTHVSPENRTSITAELTRIITWVSRIC